MKQALRSTILLLGLVAPPVAASLASCGGGGAHATADSGSSDALGRADITPPPDGTFCALPGSFVWAAQGVAVMPGGPASAPDLSWLTLPPGFCAHYFGTVPDVRQLRFAPGGELFVASPTSVTTGGNYTEGLAAIAVLPDDDHDGLADATFTFLGGLPSVQGLLFANGSFYYQDGATLRSVAYRAGDRSPSAPPYAVATISALQDGLHWPKVMDIARNGTIYVTNGGSQSDPCLSSKEMRGGIFALQPDGTATPVARGFRNPIALGCEVDHDACLAIELALDYSESAGGREKLVPVRAGDDWGYPCCATQNRAYSGLSYGDTGAAPDCSGTVPEADSFVIGHTPFGLDFETGKWAAPWQRRVFVTLHGAAGSWTGARVVAIALDPATGVPLPATELGASGRNPGAMLEFASGWDDGTHAHGRPAPIAFARDGRLFLGDDRNGLIVWIAPVELMRP
jgi:glucose/arabinose dehydrogenase